MLAELSLRRGWCQGDAVLSALRECFSYTPAGADRATGYLYSEGDQLWPEPLAVLGPALLGMLATDLDVKFTVVAFQAYRDGAGCDWHTDTPFDSQAVLSLGVSRVFAVRSGDRVEAHQVHHGDLVVMPS